MCQLIQAFAPTISAILFWVGLIWYVVIMVRVSKDKTVHTESMKMDERYKYGFSKYRPAMLCISLSFCVFVFGVLSKGYC